MFLGKLVVRGGGSKEKMGGKNMKTVAEKRKEERFELAYVRDEDYTMNDLKRLFDKDNLHLFGTCSCESSKVRKTGSPYIRIREDKAVAVQEYKCNRCGEKMFANCVL